MVAAGALGAALPASRATGLSRGAGGFSHIAWRPMLFESLFQHADHHPHQLAVADDTGKHTWQQLAAAAAGLGMYLSFQTDRPRVGLLLPSSMGFAASFYGTLLAGKTVVPINFLLGDREVQPIIADSGIDTVVTIPQLAQRLGADTPLKI